MASRSFRSPTYTIDRSTCPPSCLPTDLDVIEMIDITQLGHEWRVFMEPDGKLHDGAVYYAQLLAELRGSDL